MNFRKVFFTTVILFVVVVIGFGFYVVGSPQDARLKDMDNQKISDLQRISYSINQFYRENSSLPENLGQINIKNEDLLKDPQTEQSYTYNTLSNKEYELCANFNFSSKENNREHAPTPFPVDGEKIDWSHSSGKDCFKMKVTTNTNRNIP
ncbi:MAG: hypothetical protein ABEJ24_03415 [Candidatus Magasanikbacteria bacterium]